MSIAFDDGMTDIGGIVSIASCIGAATGSGSVSIVSADADLSGGSGLVSMTSGDVNESNSGTLSLNIAPPTQCPLFAPMFKLNVPLLLSFTSPDVIETKPLPPDKSASAETMLTDPEPVAAPMHDAMLTIPPISVIPSSNAIDIDPPVVDPDPEVKVMDSPPPFHDAPAVHATPQPFSSST
jgi:hypothetical protein